MARDGFRDETPGFGLSSVENFVTNGAKVVVANIDANAGRATQERFADNLRFIGKDVRQEADLRAAVDLAVDELGGLDVMYHKAGTVGTSAGIEDIEVYDWNAAPTMLLTASMLAIKVSLPAFKARTALWDKHALGSGMLAEKTRLYATVMRFVESAPPSGNFGAASKVRRSDSRGLWNSTTQAARKHQQGSSQGLCRAFQGGLPTPASARRRAAASTPTDRCAQRKRTQSLTLQHDKLFCVLADKTTPVPAHASTMRRAGPPPWSSAHERTGAAPSIKLLGLGVNRRGNTPGSMNAT